MIAIIDYDAGNLKSVQKALSYIGEDSIITRDEKELLNADKVILPGVGHFKDAMDKINGFGLNRTIHSIIGSKIPFLGICLGQQLLFESSDEAPGVQGLGVLQGKILRIPEHDDLKIPHIGWNSITIKNDGKLFKNVPNQSYVYFVHSYYLKATDSQIVKATTEYGITIDASVEKDNIYACQFHPEKSGEVGLQILKNFANI